MIDALLSQLETDLGTFVTAFVTTARAHLENEVALVAEERTRGLTEVAEERAEMALKRAELSQEIEVMQMHREMQQGRIGVNIGGYRFETTVQTLRRVPNTFFDAYFSGRYAQDVCNDGSIFVDRDGEHFGHILEYMRYQDGGGTLSTMERYSTSGWSAAVAMGTPRYAFGAWHCVVAGNICVSGGLDGRANCASVEIYAPLSDTWSFGVPLSEYRCRHAAVPVGSAMYILGGEVGGNNNSTVTATVLKIDRHGTYS
jgi:hypothetical protein